jgi:tetratricopeptide (TPR) repeat protein
MRDWRWAVLLILMAACSRSLPPFPTVNTSGFSPSIRERIDKAFETARAEPKSAEAAGRLGMLLHAHDRTEAALSCYQRARALAPEDSRWLYLTGVVLAAQARHQGAIDIFQKTGGIAGQLRLADSLLALEKFADSRAAYEKVIAQRPSDATAYYGAGRTYAAEGNLKRAVELYQQACDRFPRYSSARYALGLALRQMGRDAEAAAHLAQYEQDKTSVPPREDPLLSEVHSLSGGILPLLSKAKSAMAAGRADEALALHQQALQVDPDQEQIHINLISLYGRLKRFDDAERHYRIAIAGNTNRAEAHYNYAVMLTSQGRLAEAIDAYQRTLQANPQHAEAHNNLAYLLAQRRNFAGALQHALKALDSKPDYPQAHYNAAMILLARGEARPAIRHLEAAVKTAPNEPRYAQGLAAARSRESRSR